MNNKAPSVIGRGLDVPKRLGDNKSLQTIRWRYQYRDASNSES